MWRPKFLFELLSEYIFSLSLIWGYFEAGTWVTKKFVLLSFLKKSFNWTVGTPRMCVILYSQKNHLSKINAKQTNQLHHQQPFPFKIKLIKCYWSNYNAAIPPTTVHKICTLQHVIKCNKEHIMVAGTEIIIHWRKCPNSYIEARLFPLEKNVGQNAISASVVFRIPY